MLKGYEDNTRRWSAGEDVQFTEFYNSYKEPVVVSYACKRIFNPYRFNKNICCEKHKKILDDYQRKNRQTN